MENLGFDSLLSAERINEVLSHGPATSTLVAQAQEIAQQWETDILREHNGHKVMTGALLRALLDYASKDSILGYEDSAAAGVAVTGERYTATVLVCAHEPEEARADSAGSVNGGSQDKIRAVALAWLDGMLFNSKPTFTRRRAFKLTSSAHPVASAARTEASKPSALPDEPDGVCDAFREKARRIFLQWQ